MTKPNLKRYLSIFSILLFSITHLTAQPHYKIIDYEKLNNQVTIVNRIVRDVHGMMWFSSDDGLYRYDGYDFVNFKSRNGDGVNMPSNRISTMYASSEGGIWCLLSGRPFLFDTRTCRFIDVMKDYEQQQGTHFYIRKMRVLSCGTTWFFAEDGTVLNLEDARPTQSIRQIATGEDANNVTAVCDSLGRSWVLTTKHTFLYHRTLKTFDQTFRRIVVSGRHVWLMTDNGQIAKYDERQQRPVAWHHDALQAKVVSMSMLSDGTIALSMDTQLLLASPDGKRVRQTSVTWPVQKMMEDRQGHLWMLATDGTLSVSDKNCQQINHVEGILSKDKCDVMSDPHGTVWIFTGSGDTYYALADNPTHPIKYTDDDMHVNITNTIDDGQSGYWFIHHNHAYRLTFESPHYRYLPLHEQGQVRCVVSDAKGRLLVGSRYDETVTVFSATGERLGWLGRDGRIHSTWTSFGAAAYCGFLASDGTLWLGTKKNGLFRLRPQTDNSYEINQYSQENSALTDNEVYAIAEDQQHRLWIATHIGGLCCITDYRVPTPQFVTQKNGLPGWKDDRTTSIRTLLVTPAQQLLVGTYNGLFVADIKGSDLRQITFKQHQREADRKESLGSSGITDVLQTKDGRVFLATCDGGVNELLTKDIMADRLDFRHYNRQTGFPADIIHAIKEYRGALWAIAPNQLIELQLGQSTMPGINSFLLRERPHFSSCRPVDLGQGKWVMGAENGALLVNLDELKNSSFVPPLVITGVSKENGAVDHAVIWSDTIVLNAHQRDLTVWFSALDYEDTELVAYAYRMGNNKEWTYIGQNHSITLAQMQPGIHQMTIRSTNSNGAWCDNERTLTIIVTPTFWETIWGKLLIAFIIIAIGGIIGYTLLYIKRIKRKQRETMEAYLALLEEKAEKGVDTGISEDATDAGEPNTALVEETEDDLLMKRVVAYLEDNLSDSDITIDDIAQAVGMSRTSLHRKMKQLMGTSPMEFLREARIRKAVKMLETTSKNVSEIAYQCGFSDPKYFSKCFKSTFGQTPSEYKQNQSQ